MAATSVGEIGLDLVVNKGQFNKQMAGIQSMAKKAGVALAGAFAIKKLVQFGKQCIELGSDLEEVQNVVDVTFPRMSAKVDEFAKNAATSFGMSEAMAKKFTGTYGAMAKSFGFAEAQAFEMSSSLTQLAGDVASFYNLTQDEAYTKLKSVFTGETESLKDLGVVMTQTALDAYALENGFGKATKSMAEAEKVALRYAFVQDKLSASSGDFSRTFDSWANQTRYLKLQLESLKATLGQGLINIFKPLLKNINVMIGKFNEFSQSITNALGSIFGWKKESSGGIAESMGEAELSSGTVADNLDNANSNADKLKRTLMGFDAINKLSDNSDNVSSSAGNSGTSGGAGSSDTWTKNDGIIEKFKSEIKSLEELGSHIGNSLSKCMESIDWESIYKKAENFGVGLAEFLNGLISPELFYNFGRTIANSINTAFSAANAFAIEFDWENLGASIASSITGFFENWDAELTANTFSNFTKGILKSIRSAVDGLVEDETFETIGQKIAEFICGIDWLGVSWDFTKLFMSLSQALLELPADLAEGFAKALIEKITGKEIDIPDNWFEDLMKNIWGSQSKGLKIALSLPDKKEIDNLKDKLKEKWNTLNSVWKDVEMKLLAKASTSKKTIEKWYKERKEVWKNKTASFKASVSGKKADLKKKWKNLTGDIKDKVVTITAKLKDNISAAIKTMWNGIAKGINKAIDVINKIPNVNINKLPYLAQGGYVKRNTPRLAVIGDNTRYGEIVAPEDKLENMARRAAAMAGGGAGSVDILIILKEILAILRSMNIVGIDEEALRKYFVAKTNANTKQYGKCELIL